MGSAVAKSNDFMNQDQNCQYARWLLKANKMEAVYFMASLLSWSDLIIILDFQELFATIF